MNDNYIKFQQELEEFKKEYKSLSNLEIACWENGYLRALKNLNELENIQKLSFEELEKEILSDNKIKAEYVQACIVILRNIFKNIENDTSR